MMPSTFFKKYLGLTEEEVKAMAIEDGFTIVDVSDEYNKVFELYSDKMESGSWMELYFNYESRPCVDSYAWDAEWAC